MIDVDWKGFHELQGLEMMVLRFEEMTGRNPGIVSMSI